MAQDHEWAVVCCCCCHHHWQQQQHFHVYVVSSSLNNVLSWQFYLISALNLFVSHASSCGPHMASESWHLGKTAHLWACRQAEKPKKAESFLSFCWCQLVILFLLPCPNSVGLSVPTFSSLSGSVNNHSSSILISSNDSAMDVETISIKNLLCWDWGLCKWYLLHFRKLMMHLCTKCLTKFQPCHRPPSELTNPKFCQVCHSHTWLTNYLKLYSIPQA